MGWVARRLARNNGTQEFLNNALNDDGFRTLYVTVRQPGAFFQPLAKRIDLSNKLLDPFDCKEEKTFVQLAEAHHPDTGTSPPTLPLLSNKQGGSAVAMYKLAGGFGSDQKFTGEDMALLRTYSDDAAAKMEDSPRRIGRDFEAEGLAQAALYGERTPPPAFVQGVWPSKLAVDQVTGQGLGATGSPLGWRRSSCKGTLNPSPNNAAPRNQRNRRASARCVGRGRPRKARGRALSRLLVASLTALQRRRRRKPRPSRRRRGGARGTCATRRTTAPTAPARSWTAATAGRRSRKGRAPAPPSGGARSEQSSPSVVLARRPLL